MEAGQNLYLDLQNKSTNVINFVVTLVFSYYNGDPYNVLNLTIEDKTIGFPLAELQIHLQQQHYMEICI